MRSRCYYTFFAIESLAICLAQMLSDKAPRIASVVAGAVILPLFSLDGGELQRESPSTRRAWSAWRSASFPLAHLLGYLTGTCAAGVFLGHEPARMLSQGPAAARRPRLKARRRARCHEPALSANRRRFSTASSTWRRPTARARSWPASPIWPESKAAADPNAKPWRKWSPHSKPASRRMWRLPRAFPGSSHLRRQRRASRSG